MELLMLVAGVVAVVLELLADRAVVEMVVIVAQLEEQLPQIQVVAAVAAALKLLLTVVTVDQALSLFVMLALK
jgi:hypothetical protein